MVNILQEQPSFAQSILGSLGAGVGSGIAKGADFALKMGLKNQNSRQKNLSKVRSGVKSFLSLYDKNKAFSSNPESIQKLEDLSRKYVEGGLSNDDAISAAYKDILNAGGASGEKKEYGAFEGNPNFFNDIAKKLGLVSDEGFLEDVKTGVKKGLRPLVQLFDFPLQFAKRSGVSPRGAILEDFDTLTDYYDKFTEGKGKPQNIVERLTAGYPLGGPGVAAAGVEETLNTFGAPESVQETGGLLTLLLSHRFKLPGAKEVVNRAKKVAEETGKSPDEVLKEAQEASGVSLEDIAKGDEVAINSLKNRITPAPKGSEKVTETPKTVFNKKAAQRERRVFGEKLAESPLDEYYDIKNREFEKQQSKKPETVAREAEVRKSLAPEEKKLFEDLRNKREDLARMEKAIKNLTGQEKARVEVLRSYRLKSIQEASERLKDIQYQMKYARPRPSEAEINAQIESSVKRYREGIENPTPEKIKDLERQLELDKKYIERADKLSKRGELGGEIRPDTFLRMKSKYLEGYKAAIKEAKETVNSLKGETDPMLRSKMAQEKQLIDTLQNRVKRLEADIINQKDNIKAMRALEKPSGAFYKQQLKNLKRDHELFKNDLFKKGELKSPEDLKTSKVYKQNSPEVKLGKETVENPSPENLQKTSQETGKSPEEISQELKKEGKEFLEEAKKINEGTITPKDESAFMRRAKRVVKLFGAGFSLGAIQALIEESFDVQLNARMNKTVGYIVTGISFGVSFGGAQAGHSYVRSLFDQMQADKLKEMKNDPLAWNRYIMNMRKSAGDAKVKRVLKIVNE